MNLYESVEIATSEGFHPVSAIVEGPFFVHCTGQELCYWPDADDWDPEESDGLQECDVYVLSHLHTGWALTLSTPDQGALLAVARDLCADPQLFPLFSENDRPEAIMAGMKATPGLGERFYDLVRRHAPETAPPRPGDE